ncbi:MAG: cobalamin B12-binding domain-containing protein [Chloroflexi bacterium]|nr:cobalamin B12-binding domain-containing protein [Chloroflexota bacterium]
MVPNLSDLIADLQENEAIRVTKERLSKGEEPGRILEESRKGMEAVGKRFADGIYFLPDLIYSAEILKEVNAIVQPLLKTESQAGRQGRIVVGTVAGDIHDIGKDMVVFMLDVSGYNVCDLGVDVPVQKFVDAIRENDATVVGLSGFLTLAFNSMKETIAAIEDAGLRQRVKIMIGGGQIDDKVREYAGADAYGKDAMAAVDLVRKWTR